MNDTSVLRASPSKIKTLDERRRCFKPRASQKIKKFWINDVGVWMNDAQGFQSTSPLKINILDERRRCFKGTTLKFLMNDAGLLRARVPQKLKFLMNDADVLKIKIIDERRRCFKGRSPSKN